jgi:uncharacterized small protein (DUF1192 family)
MTDIAEQLRGTAFFLERKGARLNAKRCRDGADEIERLEAQISQHIRNAGEDTAEMFLLYAEIERQEAEVKRYRGILTSLRVEWVD